MTDAALKATVRTSPCCRVSGRSDDANCPNGHRVSQMGVPHMAVSVTVHDAFSTCPATKSEGYKQIVPATMIKDHDLIT